MGLVTIEAIPRRFTGCAVDAKVGDVARPGVEMPLHLRPGRKAAPRDRIPLHVADAPLVLALRSRAIRRTGADPEPPMLGEGMKPRVQHHLPTRCIMVQDQRACVVEQHLPRNPAEGLKRAFQAREPAVLLLVSESANMKTARIAERRHEKEDLRRHPADLHAPLAKIDLQLIARLRLEPDRRTRLRHKLTPQRRHRPLDRSQTHPDVLLPS